MLKFAPWDGLVTGTIDNGGQPKLQNNIKLQNDIQNPHSKTCSGFGGFGVRCPWAGDLALYVHYARGSSAAYFYSQIVGFPHVHNSLLARPQFISRRLAFAVCSSSRRQRVVRVPATHNMTPTCSSRRQPSKKEAFQTQRTKEKARID